MPGNEKDVIEFLIKNRSQLHLPIIGNINKIEIPKEDNLAEITNVNQLDSFSSDDAHKKADVFVNGKGLSIKQSGGNVAYNKIQRKHLIGFFSKFFNKEKNKQIIKMLDEKIKDFHQGKILRDVESSNIMSEEDFKKILEFLMLKGSTTKTSSFQADLILISNKNIKSKNDINIFNFNDYYDNHKNKLVFALRRCWFGQISSEHNRASSIMQSKENAPWCFNSVSGEPASNKDGEKWRKNINNTERRTIYYINIIHN